jgi:hypothetical protein
MPFAGRQSACSPNASALNGAGQAAHAVKLVYPWELHRTTAGGCVDRRSPIADTGRGAADANLTRSLAAPRAGSSSNVLMDRTRIAFWRSRRKFGASGTRHKASPAPSSRPSWRDCSFRIGVTRRLSLRAPHGLERRFSGLKGRRLTEHLLNCGDNGVHVQRLPEHAHRAKGAELEFARLRAGHDEHRHDA